MDLDDEELEATRKLNGLGKIEKRKNGIKADERNFFITCLKYCTIQGVRDVSKAISPRDIISVLNEFMNYKRCWYLLEKWTNKGFYNYGVTMDLGWFEPDKFYGEYQEIYEYMKNKIEIECPITKMLRKENQALSEENRMQKKQLLDAFDRGFIHKDKIKEVIDFAIKATNTKDDYSIGMCNGMIYIKATLLNEKPNYKSRK